MRKSFGIISVAAMLAFYLSGCSAISNGGMNMAVAYGVTTVLSLLLLVAYCCCVQKKEVWFILLFSSVLVVNIGYLTLSISNILLEALLANRIAYLGSVFLPMFMMLIILDVTKLKYKKWLPVLLIIVSMLVFFIAASPGYLDIYYKEVTLEKINGVSVLKKVYGAWHCVYLYYLMTYFAAMIGVIIYASTRKRIRSISHSFVLVAAVIVNIGVWLLEQLVNLDFEFLSVSYVISELFLLGTYLLLQDGEKVTAVQTACNDSENVGNSTDTLEIEEKEIKEDGEQPNISAQKCEHFVRSIADLTHTERMIYDFYIEGRTTKDIMQELNIKENTLKFHNKNIYGKLGVSSRKQLVEIARMIEK
ncbi:MAG: hypothetical protein IJO48_05385 [Clostridia bacterium]|nr:hypothetical protein [Clostridia bacterium]